MRDLDTELHEQYEQAEDEARGAQLVQATIADRVDDAVTAKLRAWRLAANETDPII